MFIVNEVEYVIHEEYGEEVEEKLTSILTYARLTNHYTKIKINAFAVIIYIYTHEKDYHFNHNDASFKIKLQVYPKTNEICGFSVSFPYEVSKHPIDKETMLYLLDKVIERLN